MHNQRVKFNLYVKDEFTVEDSVTTNATMCAEQGSDGVVIDVSPNQVSEMIADLAMLLAGALKP